MLFHKLWKTTEIVYLTKKQQWTIKQNMLLHSVVGDLEVDISTCREKQKLLGSFIYEV